MDRYPKNFVVASLFYFFLAAALGIWLGTASAPEWVTFAHIHFNLLGFMAMMIYGVGYFILPRFNGRTIKWPQWVVLHFYLSNIGLVGMVATAAERPSTGFTLFALLNVLSVGMFALNLGVTLLEPLETEDTEEDEPAAEVPPEPKVYITPDSRMGDIITQWPQSVDILVSNGFTPLKDPAHLEKVKSLPVTLGMACERHGLDIDLMVSLLNQAANALEKEKTRPQPAGLTSIQSTIQPGKPILHNHVIGDILKAYPETDKVFRKYYGAACFSCPAQATESIRQSAMMHNVDEKKVLADLNKAAGL
jgi:hybrid cluster-associated redox disulfide protein